MPELKIWQKLKQLWTTPLVHNEPAPAADDERADETLAASMMRLGRLRRARWLWLRGSTSAEGLEPWGLPGEQN